MRSWLRRIRGALSLGLLWGVVWAGVMAITVAIVRAVDPASVDPGEGPLRAAAIGGIFGVIAGTLFALMFAVAERRRTIADLSVWRAAVWGMLAAAAMPLLTAVDNRLLIIVCPVGGAIAAGTVALAKRASLGAPNEPPRLE
jgi:hypothetical protein